MAKRVLVNYAGVVEQVVEPGDEFEIYEGPDATVRWCNCDDDDVNDSWILEQGVWKQNVEAPPSYAVLRRSAYGEIGEQLDMLYKDMVNGTTNWVDHIAAVKEVVPGPNSDEAIEMMAARPPISWASPTSPSWTTETNEPVEGLLHTVGIKSSEIDSDHAAERLPWYQSSE